MLRANLLVKYELQICGVDGFSVCDAFLHRPYSAFAIQENSYHDLAEHWLSAINRTNELDANAVVTRGTGFCAVCGQATTFISYRVPEYTRDGVTAMTRNVGFSDGTLLGGEGTGAVMDGTPGVDAYYTGYHWTVSADDKMRENAEEKM